jgi:hypothetical protein
LIFPQCIAPLKAKSSRVILTNYTKVKDIYLPGCYIKRWKLSS